MAEQDGELAVVVYEETDGDWRPTQVFTRKWMKFYDGREGWSYQLFDGDWCRRDQQLHLYNSGGGRPYVGGYVEPGNMPGRIWIADGQAVVGAALVDGEHVELSYGDLEAMGYTVVTEHPGDIFDGASDEPTAWCEKCEDYLPRYDNPCEHLRVCWHCHANFTVENSESRCPDCNESQLECEECEEPGAETCASCTRPICKECLCECGHPLRRAPPSPRAAQREAKRRRARLRKRRGW